MAARPGATTSRAGAGDWTASLGTFAGTSGAGWIITGGQFEFAQYYLAEWRNLDGFDRGLSYTYDSDYLRFDTGEWAVQRVPYNAPGMLVWYRDIQYGAVNNIEANLFALPSVGAKGGLLMVDSHFDPLRRTGEAAAHDPTTLKNIQSRPQAANAAFGVQSTYGFTECLEDPPGSYVLYCTVFGPQAPVSKFMDTVTWYPGLELRQPAVLPRQRRIGGDPVRRAPAIHRPVRGSGREPAARLLRAGSRKQHRPRHREPG